jgi:predicted Zn-dependent protease
MDFASMSAPDLANLTPASLSSADLDRAYQAALKLNERDLAGKFAADLVGRPAYPERPDRFPLFQLLISQSLAQGDTTVALDHVNEGERIDCEQNEGKRRNDYELRRAQVHAKRGEFDQAEEVYDRLITRSPSELNVRVNAAETMLSARQGARAKKYAQQGLSEALKQNNRDLEGHFKELLAAAGK